MPAKKITKVNKIKKAVKKNSKQMFTSTCGVCSAGVLPMKVKNQACCSDFEELKPSQALISSPAEDSKQSCARCDHIPGRISAVLGLLVVVIIVLSMTVLASVMIISSQAFQIQAYNSSGGHIDNIVRK